MKNIAVDKLVKVMEREGAVSLFYKIIIFLIVSCTPFTARINYFFTNLIFASTVKNVQGSKMLLDLKNDKGLSKELFLRRKREIYLTDYLIDSNLLKEGDIHLDIGANRGYYVLIASKLVGDSGKVYAIEPVKSNINCLKKNIELNSCTNVETYNLAMGSKNRTSKINIRRKYNTSSMNFISDGDVIGQETIKESTVDSFLVDKDIPNLIRMDVEGYESEIIKGMKNSLKNNLKIIMEIHPSLMDERQIREMFKVLKENNFMLKKAILNPPESLLNSKAKINTLAMFFKRKLGDEQEYGYLDMNTDELLEWIIKEKKCPQLIFCKTGIDNV